MRRLLSSFLLLALLLPILAACGGGNEASPSASGGASGGASSSPSASTSASAASSSPRASASSSAGTGDASPTAFATEDASPSASGSARASGSASGSARASASASGTGTGAGAGTTATDEATIDETVAADETATTGGVGAGAGTTATDEATIDETVAADETATAGETTTAGAVGGGAGGNGERIRVGLVTDVGKINDGTFNQFAYEGLQRAEQELGVEIDFIETQQPTDYARNIDQFANNGYDLVIGVGFLMGDAIAAAAADYPDVNFAIVDYAYDDPPPNAKGLVFQEDQAGYLAGAMASLISQNRIVGVVGGREDVPAVVRYVEGYQAGAEATAAEDGSTIDVRQVYIPSFTDPAQGSEAAQSQIAEGADVIFGAGGQTGSGAIQAAALEDNVYVIGVDQDEYNTTFRNGSTAGADRLVTSAIKRVDNAVFETVQSVVDGTFNNELYVGNAANDGIGYAESHDAEVVTDEIRARLDEILAGLADGSIETGVEQ